MGPEGSPALTACEYFVCLQPLGRRGFAPMCLHYDQAGGRVWHFVQDAQTQRPMFFAKRADAVRFAGLLNKALRSQR